MFLFLVFLFFVCLEYQIIMFVISTFTPIFFYPSFNRDFCLFQIFFIFYSSLQLNMLDMTYESYMRLAISSSAHAPSVKDTKLPSSASTIVAWLIIAGTLPGEEGGGGK